MFFIFIDIKDLLLLINSVSLILNHSEGRNTTVFIECFHIINNLFSLLLINSVPLILNHSKGRNTAFLIYIF